MGIGKKKKIKPPKKRILKNKGFKIRNPLKKKVQNKESSKKESSKQREFKNKGFKKIKPLQKKTKASKKLNPPQKRKASKETPQKREFHKGFLAFSKRTHNSNTRYKACGI
ncbi:hypothetical protein BB464_02715 [Helicobacter pylori]|nr:hypothetical protein BB464_02715 [Helicobacter pylori]